MLVYMAWEGGHMPKSNEDKLQEAMANTYGNFMRKRVEPEKRKITDIPIMITNSGEILCIPDRDDEPTIGVVGAKGKGKSFFMHSLLDRAYHYYGKDCFIGNDTMSETFSWSTPNEDSREQLSLLGETPAPLPTAYFLPRVKGVVKPKKDFFYLSLPVSEILNNPSSFMEMDKSAPYFRNLTADMKEMTIPQMCNYIDEAIDDKYAATKLKLIALLTDLDNEKMIDTSDEKNVSKLRVIDAVNGKEEIYSALSACMRCGILPSVLTGDLLTKHYASDFLSYFYTDIYNNQREDPYFGKRRVWGLIDEITAICSTQKKGKAYDAILQMVARGRPVRLGIIYGTQNYSKVPLVIRTNTLYLFTLGYKNKREISAVSSDFDLSKSNEKLIRNLDTFETMAMTTEYFVCYDNNGNRRETDPDEIFTGKSLPTLSLHKKPKNTG